MALDSLSNQNSREHTIMVLNKRRLADELKTLESLRHHMERELPWFKSSFLPLYARTEGLLEAGVDLDALDIFAIVDARNMSEELRNELFKLWGFWAVDEEMARHERLVKRIRDGKQKGASWWRRTLRYCLAPYTQLMQSTQQDDLTIDKGGACTDRIHDSFSSVSGARS